jgi:hypothetical protein
VESVLWRAAPPCRTGELFLERSFCSALYILFASLLCPQPCSALPLLKAMTLAHRLMHVCRMHCMKTRHHVQQLVKLKQKAMGGCWMCGLMHGVQYSYNMD